MPSRPTEYVRALRVYPCRQCGAAPGRRCVSANGLWASTDHAARWHDAVEAGTLPLRGPAHDPVQR